MPSKDIQENVPEILKTLRDISINSIFKDITFSEYTILKIAFILRQESKNDTVYVSQIVKRLRSSTPSVSKALRNLEAKGLIRRETDPANRRRTFVWLTPEGYAAEKDSDRAFYAFFERICGKVGKENMETFGRIAVKLSAAITTELKSIQERRQGQ
ncbi:MAG TPA: hypothetical protein DIV41_01495 [Ruminococcaceae bacterium]|jgi:DNA-binding MarR family transcriptional regulator|nr:hypothetical protein [Oscillospiraceae bacterium]